MQSVPRLIISAVRGGLGKTTLSLGVIAAWRRQGRTVAPFKKGPDYIDAGWLGAAAGIPCHNLDLFLMDEAAIRRSFEVHAAGRTAAVIEGNRGLFDGMDAAGTYSTARLANLLHSPVVLIVDCTKSSSTVAAVVLGCRTFDPSLEIGGVVLNNLSSQRQESVIRAAIEQHAGVPVVGAVPRLRHGEFPERHMGLTPFHEHPDVEKAIAAAVSVAEKHLDLDALWRMAANGARESSPVTGSPQVIGTGDGESAERPIIGVIRDRAFQFYYPDNLEALEQQGAALREINALEDRELPEVDALYIGGGFPEMQAAELAANTSFSASLHQSAEQGLPVYAECGGLIYLGRSLQVGDRTYPMAGVLPADFVLEKRPQGHGYTVMEVTAPNAFFEIGSVLRGHEFHYSRVSNPDAMPSRCFRLQRGVGIDGRSDGMLYRNVLASYSHIHAAGAPQWAEGMVTAARAFRRSRTVGVR
jgi:cobyrinic acid a,c-diamide synthase